MTQAELEALTSAELFDLCTVRFENDQYWEEFVRRFNQSLARSIYHAYRRFSGGAYPPHWVAADLLQETYLKILKDRCSSLRRFRGNTEMEAEVYLMHIATSVTVDHLRRRYTLKRQARAESFESSRPIVESQEWLGQTPSPYTDELAERELIKILRRTFPGKNSERDILIFLLHSREGLTAQEIANANICDLKPSSIAHTLDRMRDKLREILLIKK